MVQIKLLLFHPLYKLWNGSLEFKSLLLPYTLIDICKVYMAK